MWVMLGHAHWPVYAQEHAHVFKRSHIIHSVEASHLLQCVCIALWVKAPLPANRMKDSSMSQKLGYLLPYVCMCVCAYIYALTYTYVWA